MTAAREKLFVWLAYAGMCLIWGTTWLAIKVGLHALAPLTGVGLRFLIAGAFLYVLAFARGELRPLRELPWKLILVLAALLFGLNYILTYTAEVKLDSGLVAVLFGTLPFFAFAFAHAMLGEKITPRIWIGSLLAFGGVVVISLVGEVRGEPLFALAAIGAAASSAFANVYAKRHSNHRPLLTLPPAMVIAGAVVLTISLFAEHTDWAIALSGSSLLALLYLAIFGSGIAFFLMMWVLQRLPVSIVGLSSLVFPVIAIAVGTLFGGEHITVRELIGSALVVIGLWLALRTPKVVDATVP
ncbi:MAG: EamA family transporter [Candidatus Eremiobacteraeota bacterium]|nr:EamA family transporter [Candidatus Eremiobacteraeota bacterium]